MTSEDRIELMLDWFYENYEDPVHRMPHEAREGGYIYINGGPYDARDVLVDAFDTYATAEEIDVVIEKVEFDN